MPDAHMHKLRLGPHVRSMREAPLTLTTLAALTPLDVEVRLVDGSVDPIPWTRRRTWWHQRHHRNGDRAYVLPTTTAKRHPVVLGGVHVTILPGEAMPHADSIVVGMAERVWPSCWRTSGAAG